MHVLSDVNVQQVIQDQQQQGRLYTAIENGIYYSSNNGLDWELYNNSLPSLNLVDIRKDPYSDNLYVATSDMGVYKVNQMAVDVSKEEKQQNNYSLQQNYPNPFNPSTKINYSIPQRSFVRLKVYDILGREIKTLVNEEKSAGNYDVEFSASGGSASGGNAYSLSSGVYFYRLEAGEFSDTKKFILLR